MSQPVILMPDAELVMTVRLRAALAALNQSTYPYVAGVTVETKTPAAGERAKLVRVRRSGGTRVGVAEDAARLDFQVWHTDDRSRMALAQHVSALVFASKGLVMTGAPLPFATTIGAITEFVGIGRFDDPYDPGREIILFTVEVRLRGVAA